MLAVDGRRRISLGALARHDRYFAAAEPDGTIVLTPVVVLSVTEAAALHSPGIRAALEFADSGKPGVRRQRPSR